MINIIIILLLIYSLIITIKLILINKESINYKYTLTKVLCKLQVVQDDVWVSDDVEKMWEYYHEIDDIIFRAYHGKDVV